MTLNSQNFSTNQQITADTAIAHLRDCIKAPDQQREPMIHLGDDDVEIYSLARRNFHLPRHVDPRDDSTEIIYPVLTLNLCAPKTYTPHIINLYIATLPFSSSDVVFPLAENVNQEIIIYVAVELNIYSAEYLCQQYDLKKFRIHAKYQPRPHVYGFSANIEKYQEMNYFITLINKIQPLTNNVISLIETYYQLAHQFHKKYKDLHTLLHSGTEYLEFVKIEHSYPSPQDSLSYYFDRQIVSNNWFKYKIVEWSSPYDPRCHSLHSTQQLNLIYAISINDIKSIHNLLAKDMSLILQPDMNGNLPMEVALQCKNLILAEELLASWHAYPHKQLPYKQAIDKYQQFKNQCEVLKKSLPLFPPSNLTENNYEFKPFFPETKFHQAILDENIKLVKELIDDNPQVIYEVSNLGFDALTVAVGNDYYEIAKHLLKSGAKATPYFNDTMKINVNVLDCAKNEKMYRLLLSHYANSNDIYPLLKNIKMALKNQSKSHIENIKTLLFYGVTDNRDKQGMTAFELVLSSFYNMLGFHNVEQSISRVLFNLFMQLFYARKCIFMPKYSVPEIIQQDILQHNQRLRQFISPSVQLQHIRYKYSEKDKMHYIETKFINKKDETNKLKFKCFNSTSLYDEKGDLKNIGNQFKRIFVQSPFNVFQHRCTSDDYFYAYFPKYDKTKKGRECTYIEVGLVNGEMSSFISFTLFFEKDLVTRFDHAYSPPGFPMKNLLMFGCRFLPSLTITFPDKKHFAVQELLSPGYAWRSLLLETRFHPKYQQPDVAEKLFKIAGIPGVDKNTSTRLVELFITINKKNVNPDLPTYIDFMIQEFAHFLSDCNKSLCTIADHTNWEAFIAHFNAVKPLGFTESDLNTIGKGLLKLDK